MSIALAGITAIGITGAAHAGAVPPGGGYRFDDIPNCTFDVYPKQYLGVSSDPSTYVACGNTPAILPGDVEGRLEHCGKADFTFNEQMQGCVRQGDPATITVDSVSHQHDQPATAIDVAFTYRGWGLDRIQAIVTDTSDSGKSALVAMPPGQLISDGNPHQILLVADSTLVSLPLTAYWQPQPGETIQVQADLVHLRADPNVGEAPLYAANTTSTFTVPGEVPSRATTPSGPTEPPRPMLPTALSWAGTWTSGDTTLPVTLNLDSIDPLDGQIEIQGLCSARWTQQQRTSDTSRVVAAHVISGSQCTDNRWDVTMGPDSITGYDVLNGGSRFTVSPS